MNKHNFIKAELILPFTVTVDSYYQTQFITVSFYTIPRIGEIIVYEGKNLLVDNVIHYIKNDICYKVNILTRNI